MHIAPLVQRFPERHPQLKISLDFTNRVVDLVAEGMDVAIRIARHLDTSLAGQQLAISRLMPLASPSYLARHGHSEQPQQLADHPALCFAVPAPMDEWSYESESQRGSVKMNVRLDTSSSEALRIAAVKGGGVTLLPTFVAGRDMEVGHLAPLFPEMDFGALKIYAVYPHRRHMPAKVRALVSFLKTHFGDDPVNDPFLPKPRRNTERGEIAEGVEV